MRGKNTMNRQTYSRKESSGLSAGLTERSDFDASEGAYSDASFNEASSGQQGFTRQVKGKLSSKSAKEKGLSFEIEGCK